VSSLFESTVTRISNLLPEIFTQNIHILVLVFLTYCTKRSRWQSLPSNKVRIL